jgi:hypothetical protein
LHDLIELVEGPTDDGRCCWPTVPAGCQISVRCTIRGPALVLR